MIKQNGALFLFYWGFDTTLGVGFENTCTVSGKGNVYRVIPRLYKWVYGHYFSKKIFPKNPTFVIISLNF